MVYVSAGREPFFSPCGLCVLRYIYIYYIYIALRNHLRRPCHFAAPLEVSLSEMTMGMTAVP